MLSIIPAIDILEGKCVRLLRGAYDEATEYDKDPAAVAREFELAGATRIHVVDLDAARGDGRNNRRHLRKLRRSVDAMIELGGGVRSEQDIEELVELGIDRFIIGTAFAAQPEIVEGWAAKFGRIFLAGIDARGGIAQTAGWREDSKVPAVDLARAARDHGACGIVYTAIEQDGTLEGPDIDGTNQIAEASGLPVVLSGGIGALSDIEAVAEAAHPNLRGVIVGKALYEGRVSLAELFERFPQQAFTPESLW